jgi:phytoene dehydrogenase-like protein
MGGSRKLVQRIEEKYENRGGKLFLNTRVDKIIVEDGAAKGLRLSNGQEVCGDYVVSATDGYEALFHLLDGAYVSDLQREMYTVGKETPLNTSFQVWAGIGADLSNEPGVLDFELPEPLTVAGRSYKRISFKNYCHDKSMAPEGCSVLTSFFYTDFDAWKELYADKEAYEAEKAHIAARVKEIIEARFPAARGRVEQMDVATPMTYVRYCNAWRGSWMTWVTTPTLKTRMLPMKLNGLRGFVMAGQWITSPGGLPTAVAAGRWAIQHLCADDKKHFIK